MLSEVNTITTETEERMQLCFVRHPDAGGQCGEPETMRGHGLGFCERHGKEARLGADSEAYDDASWFIERFRNPEVPRLAPKIGRALDFALKRLREEGSSGEDYDQALMAAYPEIPENTREQVLAWQAEDKPGHMGALDTLYIELDTMHKLLRIAHADGMTWLVEVLDQERQGLAAQAAYLLRNK